MLRTITQKCPSCGYVYVEQQHVEVQTVSIEKRYTHRPVRKLNPIRGKEIIKRDYLKVTKSSQKSLLKVPLFLTLRSIRK